MEESKQKTALVTGGTKGIGLAVALELEKNGFFVYTTARSQVDIENQNKTFTENGKNIVVINADVSNENDMIRLLSIITKKYTHLDVVVANAGIGIFKPVSMITTDEWTSVINTNLTGPFLTLKASYQHLKEAKGLFITINSLAGTNFFENGSAYNASKFGLTGFSQAAMLDCRKDSIRVSTIMPGSVSTYFNGHVPSKNDAWKIQPEDIAKLVIDLYTMPDRTLPSKIEVRPSFPK